MDNITDQSFTQEVLQSSQPTLVDFWAPWCGPCRMIAPVLEEIEKERKDLRIVKMNVDENPSTPGMFGIRGIPTLILFREGQPIAQLVGVQTKKQLTEAFNKLLQ